MSTSVYRVLNMLKIALIPSTWYHHATKAPNIHQIPNIHKEIRICPKTTEKRKRNIYISSTVHAVMLTTYTPLKSHLHGLLNNLCRELPVWSQNIYDLLSGVKHAKISEHPWRTFPSELSFPLGWFFFFTEIFQGRQNIHKVLDKVTHRFLSYK